MKIIVIEDEILVAEDLIQTVRSITPDIKVVKLLKSVKESVDYLQQQPDCDLIFSDIQLGDGLSFEIFSTTAPPSPIVFCTAYDAYLLDAFKTNGIDYLLKPISRTDIQNALEKYNTLGMHLTKGMSSDSTALYARMKTSITAPNANIATSIIVYQQDRIIPLPLEDIALCYIDLENVFIKTFDGKEYNTSKSLEDLEQILLTDFFRANRQHIVARKTIKHASYTMARKLHLSLSVPHTSKVQVSREKTPLFLRWLEGKGR